MPAKNPWQHDTNQLDNKGLDVIHPIEQVAKGFYSRMEDVKSLQEGTITPRPGTSLLTSAALEDSSPAITQTAERIQVDGTGTTSHVMPGGNFSFQNNKLYLICILQGNASVNPTVSALAAGSITWTLEKKIDFDTVGTPRSNISVFRGLVTSGAASSGVTWTTDVTSVTYIQIVEFTGVDLAVRRGSAIKKSFAKSKVFKCRV